MEKLLPWRRPFTGIPGSRHESDSIFTPENHITQPPQCQKVECICVCKQFRVCLPGISVYQSFRLTFISDAEACGRAAVVCSEQQEQEVWCGNQEMRRLGTMVFADQERGCWGAIPDLQCVIVDFCLEPREKKNKKKKTRTWNSQLQVIHVNKFQRWKKRNSPILFILHNLSTVGKNKTKHWAITKYYHIRNLTDM